MGQWGQWGQPSFCQNGEAGDNAPSLTPAFPNSQRENWAGCPASKSQLSRSAVPQRRPPPMSWKADVGLVTFNRTLGVPIAAPLQTGA